MSADKDSLYDVSLYVSFTQSASFEAFLYRNRMRPYSIIMEAHNGCVYKFDKMSLQDCSYISLMFDVTIEKMQGVLNFG